MNHKDTEITQRANVEGTQFANGWHLPAPIARKVERMKDKLEEVINGSLTWQKSRQPPRRADDIDQTTREKTW